MAATVLLKDIVDAQEMQFDEQLSFLDLDADGSRPFPVSFRVWRKRETMRSRRVPAFRHTVRRCGIEKDWFAFRDESLRKIAVEWCEEQGIQSKQAGAWAPGETKPKTPSG
jgi:hypothetical protein